MQPQEHTLDYQQALQTADGREGISDAHFIHDLLRDASHSLLGDPARVVSEGNVLIHGLLEHLLGTKVAIASSNRVRELDGQSHRVEEPASRMSVLPAAQIVALVISTKRRGLHTLASHS